MKVKRCVTVFAFVIGLLANCTAQMRDVPVSPPFTIVVQSSSSVYKIGAPIVLGITITNVSQSAIGLEAGPGSEKLESHFFVVAVRADGETVQEKPYGLQVHGKGPRFSGPHLGGGSRYIEEIAPGKSAYHEIDANKLNDFAEPGTYDVYIKRNRESAPNLFIESNHFRIVIEQ
jgi:hypothetical protein